MSLLDNYCIAINVNKVLQNFLYLYSFNYLIKTQFMRWKYFFQD